ncbi:MAG: PAS domain-containing protein [Desulfosudis oleivorans]|nr:PAS domain-containing protein [Desulfosudis oleivorans]
MVPVTGRPSPEDDDGRRNGMEEALRRSEEQYPPPFREQPLAPMMVYNVETLAAISVNDAAVNLYGYPRDEFLSLTVGRHPAARGCARTAQASLPEEPILPEIGEWRHRKKDGAIIHVEVKGATTSPVHGEPRPGSYLSMTYLERKTAEEALSRRDSILEAASFAAGEFLRTISWDDSIRKVLEMLGKATGVSRVHVFEQAGGTGDVPRVSLLQEWTAARHRTPQVQPGASGICMASKGVYPWADILSKGEILYGHTRVFPPAEQNTPLHSNTYVPSRVVPIFVAHDL